MNNDFFSLLNGSKKCPNDLDINKILVILLILAGKLDIEYIQIAKNNFFVTLGTLNNDL